MFPMVRSVYGVIVNRPESMQVRAIRRSDATDWERMRQALWPSSPGEHAGEIEAFFAGDRRNPAEVFLAFDDRRSAVGFAEVSIRPYAEECYSGRVAILEGWFVEESRRRHGIRAALLSAVEEWARTQGCTEMASDTGLDNAVGAAAHRSLGFSEVGRVLCFRKDL